MNRRGGFNMSTRALLVRGGKDGPTVIPGDAEKSRLVHVVRRDPGWGKPMPEDGPLPAADVAAIAKWIQDGAAMPDGELR